MCFLVIGCLFGCESNTSFKTGNYPDQFGEIPFDSTVDDPSFKLCDATTLVHSRVSLSYVEGRKRIEEISKEAFEAHGDQYAYDGYVIARFIVNCNGEVGRLRLESLNDAFVQQECPEGLISLIRESVEALNEWVITVPSNRGKDHSKYLNFKIKNGQIDAIIH